MAKAFVKHDYAVTGRDYVETEGGGDTPAGGISYSTDEHIIGTVADKTLYGKTIIVNSVAANTFISQAHGISDIDTIWNIRGVVLYGTGNAAMVGPYIGDLSNLTNYAGARVSGDSIALKIGSDLAPGTVMIDLEYTKTE